MVGGVFVTGTSALNVGLERRLKNTHNQVKSSQVNGGVSPAGAREAIQWRSQRPYPPHRGEHVPARALFFPPRASSCYMMYCRVAAHLVWSVHVYWRVQQAALLLLLGNERGMEATFDPLAGQYIGKWNQGFFFRTSKQLLDRVRAVVSLTADGALRSPC